MRADLDLNPAFRKKIQVVFHDSGRNTEAPMALWLTPVTHSKRPDDIALLLRLLNPISADRLPLHAHQAAGALGNRDAAEPDFLAHFEAGLVAAGVESVRGRVIR